MAAALFAIGMLSGFTTQSGIGSVSYESSQQIAPGTSYMHIVGTNTAAGGIVSAHVIGADVASGKVKPYVYNGLVRKTYTLSSMASIIANEGYKVVAGVNGDIFDMSSGTPKGAVIHDGILITGGYQSEYLLTFDKEGNAAVSKQPINYKISCVRTVEGIAQTVNTDICYFNVPHGGGNALHLFNTRYASSTKTSGTCAEAILTIKDTGTDTNTSSNSNTKSSRGDLRIGGTIKAEVTSVNAATCNTPIKENQLVLSANNKSAWYGMVSNLVVGTEVTIKVSTDADSPLNKADEAMGIYNLMALNGKVLTTNKTLNPRTCIGIKENGETVLFVVDGRQSSVSKGMNAVDVTSYLMSLGCVTVVNMDGGGSTTMVARDEPGKNNSAVVVNSPSDGMLRSIANALFFVYTTQAGTAATQIAVYPENTLVVPGMSVQLSSYGMNELYEKAELPGSVTYSVDADKGSVNSSGVFTSSENASGPVTVTASCGENITGSTIVTVIRDFTFTLNKSSLTLSGGKSFDLNVTGVKYGNSKVQYKDSCFKWSCTPETGTIDSNGLFKATSKSGEFKGYITCRCGDKSLTIPVYIQYTAQFNDVKSHWARDYILSLSDRGIVSGMTATKFEPDSSLTRAQFLTLLSKIDSSENVKGAKDAGFTDVAKGSWYYDCVCWGVENGIVSGMGDGRFAPDAKVSREQMCVMLCNYYSYKGMKWSSEGAELTFKDKSRISSWSNDAVKKIVGEKIMSGRTDGTFDPQGNATRGEAAKIIYLVEENFAKQQQSQANLMEENQDYEQEAVQDIALDEAEGDNSGLVEEDGTAVSEPAVDETDSDSYKKIE